VRRRRRTRRPSRVSPCDDRAGTPIGIRSALDGGTSSPGYNGTRLRPCAPRTVRSRRNSKYNPSTTQDLCRLDPAASHSAPRSAPPGQNRCHTSRCCSTRASTTSVLVLARLVPHQAPRISPQPRPADQAEAMASPSALSSARPARQHSRMRARGSALTPLLARSRKRSDFRPSCSSQDMGCVAGYERSPEVTMPRLASRGRAGPPSVGSMSPVARPVADPVVCPMLERGGHEVARPEALRR
jgi:hypothetical protein